MLANGLTLKKATRNNSTGAFSTTGTIVPLIAFRASHYDSTVGGSGGGVF